MALYSGTQHWLVEGRPACGTRGRKRFYPPVLARHVSCGQCQKSAAWRRTVDAERDRDAPAHALCGLMRSLRDLMAQARRQQARLRWAGRLHDAIMIWVRVPPGNAFNGERAEAWREVISMAESRLDLCNY